MAERELSKDKAEDEGRHGRKSLNAAPEKVKAQDEMPKASTMDALPPEAHAILLSYPGFSNTANAEQKARIMTSLQHSHGNTYVQRLMKSRAIQAKLVVNPPDDQYEKEADRVAEKVSETAAVQQKAGPEEEEELLQGKTVTAAVQQKAGPEEEEEMVQSKSATTVLQQKAGPEEEEELLQGKTVTAAVQQKAGPEEEEEMVQGKTADSQVPEVSQRLEERINAARGSGEVLPDSIRACFEPHFGRDLSEVRVHSDSEADDLSRSIDAKAFTTGKDVFFRSGDYQPHSDEGRKLLGHEITHVVQQDAAPRSGNLGMTEQPAEAQMLHLQPKAPAEEKAAKTTKDPKEIAGKVLEALMKTETGKEVKKKLMKAATSEEGITTLSILAAPTLATMFAEKMEVPEALVDLVPKVAKIELGKDIELSFQPIYKGKFGEKPKEWGGMVNFTIKRW